MKSIERRQREYIKHLIRLHDERIKLKELYFFDNPLADEQDFNKWLRIWLEQDYYPGINYHV